MSGPDPRLLTAEQLAEIRQYCEMWKELASAPTFSRILALLAHADAQRDELRAARERIASLETRLESALASIASLQIEKAGVRGPTPPTGRWSSGGSVPSFATPTLCKACNNDGGLCEVCNPGCHALRVAELEAELRAARERIAELTEKRAAEDARNAAAILKRDLESDVLRERIASLESDERNTKDVACLLWQHISRIDPVLAHELWEETPAIRMAVEATQVRGPTPPTEREPT